MNNSIKYIGFFSSIVTAVVTAVTFAVAYLTPPLSGPFCGSGCYSYPFLDVASRFPRDYYWMYLAVLLYVAFIVMVVSMHHSASPEKKVYSHVGVLFSAFGALVLITDYFLQVSVVQPSLLNGETDGVSLLTQFNPHGIFIALEELGYLSMGLGFFFTSFIFGKGGLERSLRIVLLSSFTLTTVALAWFSFQYGVMREYRFEVAAISINWITLIMAGVLLGLLFRKGMDWNR